MKLIAVEEHFAVPGLAERQPPTSLNLPIRPEVGQNYGRRIADFSEYRLRDMDENGVDVQVLSLTVPGIQADVDPTSAVENARFANDYLAGVIAENPARFRGFAALPLQDPVRAADELKRCVEDLGFRGAAVNDHTHGHYLDEPQYDVVWTALESVGLPLYLHPGTPPADDWRVLAGYPEMYGAWSWAAETGAHALRLVYGGVFDRHPGATLILGHMGEFLPFQLSRMDSRNATIQTERPLRPPSEYFGSNVVITTSGVTLAGALVGAIMALGEDAVMFASDYPFESTADVVSAFEQADLSDSVRAKIAYKNAERILKL